MRKIFYCIAFLPSIVYGQNPSEQFIFPQTALYSNILQYHYSQTQWYYKDLVERGYDPKDLSNSSQQALDAIINVVPQVDRTTSILQVYQQEYIKNKNYNLGFKKSGFNIPYP
jgi:hypothetical protein